MILYYNPKKQQTCKIYNTNPKNNKHAKYTIQTQKTTNMQNIQYKSKKQQTCKIYNTNPKNNKHAKYTIQWTL